MSGHGKDAAIFAIEAHMVYDLACPADVLLIIEAAALSDQNVSQARMTIGGAVSQTSVSGGDGIGSRIWLSAAGRLTIDYHATVTIQRTIAPLDALLTTPCRALNAQLIPYLWPSRYCESDRFAAFVLREFGQFEGGAKVSAMADWIRNNLDYRSGTSTSTTTAVDAFLSRQGVCRDFAHLLTAFIRAADIPARLVSGYAYGLKTQDFHAVVEVWLADAWHLVDATGLSAPQDFVRIAVGRDATDIAFMTIFGTADFVEQTVAVSSGCG